MIHGEFGLIEFLFLPCDQKNSALIEISAWESRSVQAYQIYGWGGSFADFA